MFKDRKYDILVFDHISDIENIWQTHAGGNDVLFETIFLKSVEANIPSGIRPFYVLVKVEGEVIGILYYQLKYVRLSENLRLAEPESLSLVQKAVFPLRNAIVKSLQFQTLICGNLLVTGSYGFNFKNTISVDEQFYIVTKATDNLRNKLEEEGIYVDLILLKDYLKKQLPQQHLLQNGFTRFSVQPKMILYIHTNWNCIEDYLDALKSKYRVRAKKALVKGQGIKRKILNYDEIVQNADIIFNLYKNISDQAGFNAFLLNPLYFKNLKKSLGDKFQITSYWMNDKMIAFYSSIVNHDKLNAHFLGYDPVSNVSHQLYLNILLDIIEEGIGRKVSYIDLSRTAIEIKSSVGAEPSDLYLFVKHANPIINKSMETLLNIVKPDKSYIIRKPFR